MEPRDGDHHDAQHQDAPPEPPLAVAAVLLFSADPERLARFYVTELGIPLRLTAVPDLPRHWACDIGHVYVSIWPHNDDQPDEGAGAGRGGVALYVRNVQQWFDRLTGRGVPVIFPPKRTRLGMIARLRDPDGNPFELYQP